MQLGNYGLYIREGNYPVPEQTGYVALSHNTQYTIGLNNYSQLRCDAIVEIDGKHVGTWRLNKNSRIVIERHANEKRLFTFLKRDTQQGDEAGLNKVTKDDMGVVSVLFIPEKKVYRKPYNESLQTYGGDYTKGDFSKGVSRGGIGGASVRKSFSAGGTGLSGESNQNFGIADEIELDHDNAVKISLRLICVDETKTEPIIEPLEDVRNMKSNKKETTVPLPIDKKLTKSEFFRLCTERFTTLTNQDLIHHLTQLNLHGKIDQNNLTVADVEVVSEQLFGGWM